MKTWMISLCLLLAVCGTGLAGGISIHRMVVGQKVLGLQDTLPLTTHADGDADSAWISPDGKYIVYAGAGDDERLCLVRASGGRPAVLMEAPKDHAAQGPSWAPYPAGSPSWCSPAWSPDSKLIAFRANLLTPGASGGETDYSSTDCIIIMTTAGQVRAQFELPKSTHGVSPFCWSSDSRRLACTALRFDASADKAARWTSDVLVLETLNGTMQTICSKPDANTRIRGWGADGKSLLYAMRDPSGWKVTETYLDGRPDMPGQTIKTLDDISPDGHWKKGDCKGLCVQNCATGETKQVFKDSAVDFMGWTPDSKMIMYRQPVKIFDVSGKRSRELNSLWLAVPEEHRLNHMCVALDVDKDGELSLSADCLKVAYVSQGRVYLAQLGWMEPDISEKTAVGIALSEEEQKRVLTNDAKQIGLAAFMYAVDHGDKFPSDAYADEMGPYFGGNDILGSLGPNVTFQYTPPGGTDGIKDPANTVMGVLDAGYQWQVVLYADGHVKVVPKTK